MLFQTARKFKPDIFLSHGSLYAAQIARLLSKPHISFEDTFNFEQIRLYKPFTSVILTSTYDHPSLGPANIKYNGYHELAYLHPNRFNPDPEILKKYNLDTDSKYLIIRFVAWNATHDAHSKGLDMENKRMAVDEFSKYGRVFISSESSLPSDLEKYRLNISPEDIHHIMAFASLIFGESATMVAEGAMLGVPGIYLDHNGRLYTKDLEDHYDLVYNFTESNTDQLKAIKKGTELLLTPGLKEKWRINADKMISEKIDVSAFLVWFVENYPGSKRTLKENPEYQLRFKLDYV